MLKRAFYRFYQGSKWGFGRKLMVSYLIVVTFPIMILGGFSYIYAVQAIEARSKESMQTTLTQIHDNILYKVQDIERISDLVYNDTNFQFDLRTQYEGIDGYRFMTQIIVPKFSSIINSGGTNFWLSLFLRNSSIRESYNDHLQTNPLVRKRSFDLYHLERIEQEEWYKKLGLSNIDPKAIWRVVESDSRYGNISLLRKLYDFETQQEIGMIRIAVRQSDLFDSLDYRKLGKGTAVVLRDANGQLIYDSAAGKGDGFEASRLFMQKYDYTRVDKRFEKTGWQLSLFIPKSEFQREVRNVAWITAAVCLASIGVVIMLSVLVSRYFTHRMEKIVTSLKSFREGEFKKRILYTGSDEFSNIAEAFNGMADTIEELIDKVLAAGLQKKEAELEILQAQINPHFLYNSLSTISRLGKLGEVDRMHGMVMSLAKFYRLTLNSGRSSISLLNELQQVQAYMEIQQIRHNGHIEITYECDPSLLHCQILKLLIQPFVENVLKHAWYNMPDISIRIVIEEHEGVIRIKVIDNGIGMRREKIRTLSQFSKDDTGYGVYNVNQRIKLHYGNDYGVSIVSIPGAGTTVSITLKKQ